MPRETAFLKLPFPSPLEEPYLDSIEGFFANTDTNLFSAVTDRNLVITGGGTVNLDTGSDILSWSDTIQLTNFVTGFFQEIPADSVTLLDGELLAVNQVRGLTDITGPIDISGSLQTPTKLLSSPREEFHLKTVICARFGDSIHFLDGKVLAPDTPTAILTSPTVGTPAFAYGSFATTQYLNDELVGTPDGVLTEFFLRLNPETHLVAIYKDGMRFNPGVDYDYKLPRRISFALAPAGPTIFTTDFYEPKVSLSGNFLETNLWSEIPSGAIDGANDTYVLANSHATGTLRVWLDGMRMEVTTDYSISDSVTFVMAVPPLGGSVITVDYVEDRAGVTEFTPNFVFNEIPTKNTAVEFEMVSDYVPGTTQVFKNGLRMKLGVDYAETPTDKITFTVPTAGPDVVVVDYQV